MATYKEAKIKKLLAAHKPETICLASWLKDLGISHDLQKHYRRSGWLESVGTGAFKRPHDEIGWQGAVYALQQQAKLPVHVGALSAISLHGAGHYIRLGKETIFLLSSLRTQLPAWFRKREWDHPIQHIKTSFLPEQLGLQVYDAPIPFTISSRERAIMECLYVAPDCVGIVESFYIMQGLSTLRPSVIQPLLEGCQSIKVKRLFLYMADKVDHAWLEYIDQSKLDLGSGDRKIGEGGTYIPRFRISVPRELIEADRT